MSKQSQHDPEKKSDLSASDGLDFTVYTVTELLVIGNDISKILRDNIGISSSQYQILLLLYGKVEGISVSYVSRDLSKPPSTITSALDGLSKKGMISRKFDSADARVSIVSITDEGSRIVALANSILTPYVDEVWSCMSNRQRQLTAWGSVRATNERGRTVVADGKVDVHSAYCDAIFLSLETCKRMAKRHDMTLNEYRVMKTVEFLSNASAADLCVKLLLSSSEFSQVASLLMRKGFLERAESPDDRRVHRFKLTEEGAEAVRAATPDIRRGLRTEAIRISREEADEYARIAESVVGAKRENFKLR
ncbi:MAG: MarR family winged helix-turn-helix transcriptional regulator [Coriobacteriales bacterium]